jgi:hypothetical protein
MGIGQPHAAAGPNSRKRTKDSGSVGLVLPASLDDVQESERRWYSKEMNRHMMDTQLTCGLNLQMPPWFNKIREMCFIFILFTVNWYSFIMQFSARKISNEDTLGNRFVKLKSPKCTDKLCNKNKTYAIFLVFQVRERYTNYHWWFAKTAILLL